MKRGRPSAISLMKSYPNEELPELHGVSYDVSEMGKFFVFRNPEYCSCSMDLSVIDHYGLFQALYQPSAIWFLSGFFSKNKIK